MYKLNKQKCISCGACLANCPGATRISSDGKAEIVDQGKLEGCGGESVCPMGAIEKVNKKRKSGTETSSQSTPQTPLSYQSPPFGGRGIGAGRGRSLGIGPRDGRGRGRDRGGGGKG